MKGYFGVLFLLTLTACASTEARGSLSADDTSFATEERPLATTLVYSCGDYEFIARLGAGEMALWLEDRYVVLSQVRSASGTLYKEGDISFWSKGSEAMLTVADQIYQNCHLRPERAPWEDARRRGVDFRGAGSAFPSVYW